MCGANSNSATVQRLIQNNPEMQANLQKQRMAKQAASMITPGGIATQMSRAGIGLPTPPSPSGPIGDVIGSAMNMPAVSAAMSDKRAAQTMPVANPLPPAAQAAIQNVQGQKMLSGLPGSPLSQGVQQTIFNARSAKRGGSSSSEVK